MHLRFLLLILFLLLIPTASAQIIINEIMYDPLQNDAYNEWAEVYNTGDASLNLENWTLCDKKIIAGYVENISGAIHLNYSTTIPAKSYAIITDGGTGTEAYDNFNISESAVVLHVNVSEICSGLTNTANKTIWLKNASGNIIENITYSPAWGANGNGKTLERNASGWFESTGLGGTPGAANSILFSGQNADDNGSAAESQNPANQAQESSPATRLEIIRSPSSMKFGDFTSIQARFLSGNRGFSKMRFAAYVWSPAWIARDMTRDESTLRNAPYNAAAAAEAENIAENTTTDILLPLFLKCNTEGKYAAGSYTVRVRGYSFRDGSWSEVAERDAQIPVSGENELCGAEIVYVNKTIKESCTPAPARNEMDALRINITAPEIAFLGDNFTTTVLLKNRANNSLDLEIYSYLYEHSTIMSQGWSGEKWGNSRTANARKVVLAPDGSETIELLNMPRESIAAEKYTFKVRIDDMNDVKKSEERIFLIDVKAPPEKGNVNVEIKNESSDNRITGAAAAEHSENTGGSFWDMLINRIKSWLEW